MLHGRVRKNGALYAGTVASSQSGCDDADNLHLVCWDSEMDPSADCYAPIEINADPSAGWGLGAFHKGQTWTDIKIPYLYNIFESGGMEYQVCYCPGRCSADWQYLAVPNGRFAVSDDDHKTQGYVGEF